MMRARGDNGWASDIPPPRGGLACYVICLRFEVSGLSLGLYIGHNLKVNATGLDLDRLDHVFSRTTFIRSR